MPNESLRIALLAKRVPGRKEVVESKGAPKMTRSGLVKVIITADKCFYIFIQHVSIAPLRSLAVRTSPYGSLYYNTSLINRDRSKLSHPNQQSGHIF